MKVIDIPVVVMIRVHDDTDEADVLQTIEDAFEHSTIGEALRTAVEEASWSVTDDEHDEDDSDDYFGYAFGRWPMRSDPL